MLFPEKLKLPPLLSDNKDIHLEKAKEIFKTKEPTTEQRRYAKNINYIELYSIKSNFKELLNKKLGAMS